MDMGVQHGLGCGSRVTSPVKYSTPGVIGYVLCIPTNTLCVSVLFKCDQRRLHKYSFYTRCTHLVPVKIMHL